MKTIIKIFIILILSILFLFGFFKATKATFDYETCKWLYENNEHLDYLMCVFTLSEDELNQIEGR